MWLSVSCEKEWKRVKVSCLVDGLPRWMRYRQYQYRHGNLNGTSSKVCIHPWGVNLPSPLLQLPQIDWMYILRKDVLIILFIFGSFFLFYYLLLFLLLLLHVKSAKNRDSFLSHSASRSLDRSAHGNINKQKHSAWAEHTVPTYISTNLL